MILKKPLFLFLFFIVLVIGILHQIAIRYYLYWTLDWFDILMHFLGGFWIAFATVWTIIFSDYFRFFQNKNFRFFILASFLSAFVIGIFWEIFEYTYDITFWADGYVFDTVKDLVMDSLGGIVASLFLYKVYKKRLQKIEQNNVIS